MEIGDEVFVRHWSRTKMDDLLQEQIWLGHLHHQLCFCFAFEPGRQWNLETTKTLAATGSHCWRVLGWGLRRLSTRVSGAVIGPASEHGATAPLTHRGLQGQQVPEKNNGPRLLPRHVLYRRTICGRYSELHLGNSRIDVSSLAALQPHAGGYMVSSPTAST